MEKANVSSTQIYDGHTGTHPRKRKIDKDGFVCPTTPDIPRNSHHFIQDGQHSNFNALDTISNFSTFAEYIEQTDDVSVSSYFKARQDSGHEKLTNSNSSNRQEADLLDQTPNNQLFDCQKENEGKQGQISRQDSLGFEIENGVESQSGETENAYDRYSPGYNEDGKRLEYGLHSSHPNEEGAASEIGARNILKSLVKSFEQESSAMFDTWSKTFGQCGEYELLCQQRLDGMIQNARAIEDSLNGKKDALCNRLKGIGKTLET